MRVVCAYTKKRRYYYYGTYNNYWDAKADGTKMYNRTKRRLYLIKAFNYKGQKKYRLFISNFITNGFYLD